MKLLFSFILIGYLSLFVSFDDTTAAWRHWTDYEIKENAPIIVFVHGLTQYSGSFDYLASHLNQEGYNCISLDLRGHGVWKLQDDPVDYDHSYKDLITALQDLKSRSPNQRIFCIGESMGASIVLQAAAEHSELLDGVILGALGSQPKIHRPWERIVDGLKGLVGTIDVRNYIDKYVSIDKHISDEMIHDGHNKNTLTTGDILKTLIRLEMDNYYEAKISDSLPVLVVNGKQDQIVYPLLIKGKDNYLIENQGHILLSTKYVKQEVLDLIDLWLQERTNDRETKLSYYR